MTTEARSRIMRSVKASNTRPEIAVRKLAHRMGYRFRLYRADMPGKPDLAFPGRKAAIFVHGCFWHGHGCRRGARTPKTNVAYWTAKIGRNVARDRQHMRRLKSAGWRALIVWECTIKDEVKLARKIRRFLDHGS